MLERLQKIIARAGIASRRHAEELIRSGQVRVNGVVVTELGAKADPERDRVEAAGRVAEQPAQAEYYMLHKPVHVVATMSDPEGRATLRHLLRGLSGGVFPVGRLHYDASGLMLLTSDGELANRILKASASLPKVYWVKLAGRLSDEDLRDLRHRAKVKMRQLRSPGSVSGGAANPWYEVEMNDARSDVLQQALFDMDHPVEKMKRVKLGPLDLGSLPEAQYRKLEAGEIAQLRRAVERAEKAPRPVAGRRAKRRFRPRAPAKGTVPQGAPVHGGPGHGAPRGSRPAGSKPGSKPPSRPGSRPGSKLGPKR